MTDAADFQGNLVNLIGRTSLGNHRPLEIRGAIAPATQRLVTEHYSLLRKELEGEVERILQEFETAAASIEDAINQRVEATLPSLIEQAADRAFRDALNEVDFSPFSPSWGRGADRASSVAARAPSHSDGGVSHGASGDGARELPDLQTTPAAHEPAKTEAPAPDPTVETALRTESVSGAKENGSQSRDGIYEGIVQLNVSASQSSRQVVRFVRELRQRKEIRVLSLAGSHKEGVNIRLRLREPISLMTVFPQFGTVARVSAIQDPGAKESALTIRLKEEQAVKLGSWIPQPILVAEPVLA